MAAAPAGGGAGALPQLEEGVQMIVAAELHLGTKNFDFQMERHVYKRRIGNIINTGKTWEKLQLAARVFAPVENPQDSIVQSARPYGWRAILKFARCNGAHAIAGRHTPGTLATNKHQPAHQWQKPSPKQPCRRMGTRRWPRCKE